MRVKLAGVQNRIDQPEFMGDVGIEGFAQQDEFGGFRIAETLRRQQRRPGFRHQAEIDERHLEPRARRGIDEIAMEAERGADADRWPFDRGDQRLFERRQRSYEQRAGRSLGAARQGHAPHRSDPRIAVRGPRARTGAGACSKLFTGARPNAKVVPTSAGRAGLRAFSASPPS